ncbi:hypothetical protein ANCCEY_13108 [Ancylostoma ceylanicum]|uniref:Uncharacterized protein n=1 Tax=Ancylostoma ceylanicum TaxID=53326 RepID=A0A0D6L7T4_9BILA|nr:hypothetical protein ANCCEY_13108 [Ancylostoma ceylanicum]
MLTDFSNLQSAANWKGGGAPYYNKELCELKAGLVTSDGDIVEVKIELAAIAIENGRVSEAEVAALNQSMDRME